jgi:hypothetical protein
VPEHPRQQEIIELLHGWSNSIDGLKTYHCLLENIRGALLSEELMFCLSALVALHNIMSSIRSDDANSSEPVRLIDVHCLLTGEITISGNQATLRDMVWSFSRAVTYALSPEDSSYIRFLDSEEDDSQN